MKKFLMKAALHALIWYAGFSVGAYLVYLLKKYQARAYWRRYWAYVNTNHSYQHKEG